jgi:translation initiation factor IF-3
MLGVLPLSQALEKARSRRLDLVEVSPQADPPVCKILDYGKYKFQQQRKGHDNRKKQKVVHLKEIKLRPNIDKHDYDVKMRSVEKFIGKGDKVKISLRFRGREIAHQDIGLELFQRIIEETAEIAKVEVEPKMEGRQIMMLLAPAKQ